MSKKKFLYKLNDIEVDYLIWCLHFTIDHTDENTKDFKRLKEVLNHIYEGYYEIH